MPTHETDRSRIIRQNLLRICYNTFMAAPDIAVLAAHLHEAFTCGAVAYTRAEIDAEIVNLIDDGLLEVVKGHEPKAYKITSKGRNFWRANCPWEKVDEYGS